MVTGEDSGGHVRCCWKYLYGLCSYNEEIQEAINNDFASLRRRHGIGTLMKDQVLLLDLSGNNNHGIIYGAEWSDDVPLMDPPPFEENFPFSLMEKMIMYQ